MSRTYEMNLVSAIQQAFQWRVSPVLLSDSKELTKQELADLSYISKFSWNEITGDQWEKYFDVTNLLSPEAFCYFLPGLMKASLEENQPNLISVVNIITMLDRSPKPDWWDDFFVARWPLFTLSEYKVIQDWIFWLASSENSSHSDDSLERALETLDLLIKQKTQA